jgi:hypothetical protein
MAWKSDAARPGRPAGIREHALRNAAVKPEQLHASAGGKTDLEGTMRQLIIGTLAGLMLTFSSGDLTRSAEANWRGDLRRSYRTLRRWDRRWDDNNYGRRYYSPRSYRYNSYPRYNYSYPRSSYYYSPYGYRSYGWSSPGAGFYFYY